MVGCLEKRLGVQATFLLINFQVKVVYLLMIPLPCKCEAVSVVIIQLFKAGVPREIVFFYVHLPLLIHFVCTHLCYISSHPHGHLAENNL